MSSSYIQRASIYLDITHDGLSMFRFLYNKLVSVDVTEDGTLTSFLSCSCFAGITSCKVSRNDCPNDEGLAHQ
jgi:hypothetical protein